MKKNKKLPLWSRLRNDHRQPYYPQLQSPHSLDSRRILTIHLLQNHLNNPRSQSLSHSPPSAPRSPSPLSRSSSSSSQKKSFEDFLCGEQEGTEGSVQFGIRTQGLLMSCRDDDHWTVTLQGWSRLFRDPSTTNGRASPDFMLYLKALGRLSTKYQLEQNYWSENILTNYQQPRRLRKQGYVQNLYSPHVLLRIFSAIAPIRLHQC